MERIEAGSNPPLYCFRLGLCLRAADRGLIDALTDFMGLDGGLQGHCVAALTVKAVAAPVDDDVAVAVLEDVAVRHAIGRRVFEAALQGQGKVAALTNRADVGAAGVSGLARGFAGSVLVDDAAHSRLLIWRQTAPLLKCIVHRRPKATLVVSAGANVIHQGFAAIVSIKPRPRLLGSGGGFDALFDGVIVGSAILDFVLRQRGEVGIGIGWAHFVGLLFGVENTEAD